MRWVAAVEPLIALWWLPAAAWAGQACSERGPAREMVRRTLALDPSLARHTVRLRRPM